MKIRREVRPYHRYKLLSISIFSAIIITSLVIETFSNYSNAEKLAKNEALAFYNKDIIYRQWSSNHGGVYVFADSSTPPNTFLKNIINRDISLPDGMMLTLVNPAYMTRQAHELGRKQLGIIGHITSLTPLNPNNAPDEWERESLNKFINADVKECEIIEEIENQQYFRFIRPLVTEQSCLKCHAAQGYKIGDIRGGISASIPMKKYYEAAFSNSINTGIILFIILLVGNLSIIKFFSIITKQRQIIKRSSENEKKYYEELLANERRYKFIMDSMNDTITILDLDLNCKYVNPAIFKQRGFTPEERMSQKLEQILTPSSLERVKQIFKEEINLENLKNEAPDRSRLIELEHYHKNGSILCIEVNLSILRDEKETPIGIITVSRDISEKRKSEILLSENMNLFEELFNNAPIGYHEIDTLGNIVKINTTELEMLGYSRDEMSDQPLWNFMEDIETSKERILKKLTGDFAETESYERTFINKTGSKIVCLIQDKYLYSESRNLYGIRSSVQDITGRKKHENELKRELIFKEALGKIANLIIESDNQSIILNGAAEILGEATSIDRCFIYDVSFERGTLNKLAEWYSPSDINTDKTEAIYSIEMFEEPLEFVFNNRKPVISHFDEINPLLINDGSGIILHEDMQIKSGLWLPFAFYDSGFFLIALNRISKKQPWDDYEIEFIYRSSRQIEIALEKIKILNDREFFESSLIESERRNLSILSALPDMLFTINNELCFTDCQVNDEQLLLMPKSEFLGKSIFEVLDPELAELTKTKLEKALETGLIQNYQYPVIINKTTVWNDARMVKSSPTEVLVIIRDITTQKTAEKNLRASEERYKSLADNFPNGALFLNNSNYEYLIAGGKAFSGTGTKPENLIGKKIPEIFPELWDTIKPSIDNALKGVLGYYETNYLGRLYSNYVIPINQENPVNNQTLVVTLDITEQRIAEDRLRESEERFRLIAENLSEGILYINNGTIEYASPSFYSIFQTSEKETINIGQNEIMEKIHPDDRTRVIETIYSAVKRNELSAQYVYRFKLLDGTYVWREDHARFIYDSEGVQTGAYVICRDITQRMEFEQKLKEGEEKFRLMAENISDGIISFNKNNIEYISPSYTRLFGYESPEDIMDHEKEIFDLVHPDDKPAIREIVFKAISQKHESAIYSFRFKTKSGIYVWREDHSRYIYNNNNQYLGAYVVCRDITEQKLYEIRLKESDERFRSFFNSSAVGTAITDVNGRWLYFNDKLCIMLGYSKKELEKKTWFELTPEEDLRNEIQRFDSAIDGKAPADVEKRYIKKDGSIIDVLVSSSVIKNNDGTAAYFTSVIQDITERKNSSRLLETSEKKFKSIFINSSAVMMIIDPVTGKILDANRAAEYFYGYSIDKLKSMNISEINMLTVDDIRNHIDDAINHKKNYFVFPHKTFLGDYRTVEVYSTAIIQENKKVLFSIIHDITERQKMELELARSESKLRTIFLSLPDVILILDQEGKYLEIPPTSPKLLYKPSDELIGKKFAEIFPEKIAEDLLRPITQALQTNLPVYHDYEMLTDGQRRWFSAIITRYQNNTVLWVARDVSEKKSAESQIQKLLKGIEQSPSTVVITDTNGIIEYVNPKFTELTGYTTEEAIGQNPKILKAEGMRPEEYENLWKTIQSGNDWKGEFKNKKKSGEEFYESASISPIKDEFGNITNFIAIKEDITKRKEAESALLSYSLRFTTILDHFPSAVLLEDKDKKAILYNDLFSKILDFPFYYSLSDIETCKAVLFKNKHIFKLEEEFEIRINDIYSSSQKVIGEEFELKNGRIIKLDYIPIFYNEKDIVNHVWILNDITEAKREEEIKIKTEFQLQRAQKLESLGVLAGGIAHDFNNLLGAIFGYLELAIEETKDPLVSRFLDKANSSMERAKALTHQLLTFSKGGTPITKTGSLFPFIKDTALFILSGSNVSCHFDVKQDLYKCNFDRNQIGQVIDNIVINAMQAMNGGGEITIKAENVSLSTFEHGYLGEGNYIKLSISDTGVGIPTELLTKIFDPFFTTKATGNGLGLATCYSIIKSHGGIIEAVSEVGAGSAFHIYLPEASDKQTAPEPAPKVLKHSGSGNILIMDDEEPILDINKRIIESMGYTALCTNKGEDALEIFKASIANKVKIKAIIFDITIKGGMGGKETAIEIRKLDDSIPIFVSSGYSEDPILSDPRKFGFTDSLRKPVRISELYELFNKYL